MIGLFDIFRRSLTEEDKIAVYEQYDRREIEKEVARLLLGRDLDHIEEERDAFRKAMECDTASFLV